MIRYPRFYCYAIATVDVKDEIKTKALVMFGMFIKLEWMRHRMSVSQKSKNVWRKDFPIDPYLYDKGTHLAKFEPLFKKLTVILKISKSNNLKLLIRILIVSLECTLLYLK